MQNDPFALPLTDDLGYLLDEQQVPVAQGFAKPFMRGRRDELEERDDRLVVRRDQLRMSQPDLAQPLQGVPMPGLAVLCALNWHRISRKVFIVSLLMMGCVLALFVFLSVHLQQEMAGAALYGPMYWLLLALAALEYGLVRHASGSTEKAAATQGKRKGVTAKA